METIIQALILTLGVAGISNALYDHGKPRPIHSPEAIGIVVSFMIGLAVATIIFWNPETIPDVIAWITTLAIITWSIITLITHLLTRDPDPDIQQPIITTRTTLTGITTNLIIIAACTTGILA